MEVNTKKILAAVATISVTTVTAGVTVTQTNAHADTVDQAATQTTNDQLKQAEQNVDVQKQNVQSATSADNQAADAVNKAQEDVNAASDATNKASQTATSDAQAVSQASDAVKTAQDQLNAASQAAANRDQAQADLDQAKSDQAAVANQNVNGQLNSAVSDAQSAANSASAAQQQASAANDQAQTALSAAQNKLSEAEKGAGQSVTQADVDAAQSAVNDAQAQKNTADQQVNAKSAAVQTADSNVSAAQTAADQANADLNNAQQNSNAKQQALSEAQQALTNAQKQGGQTSETSTKKSVADILWIPDNFETVMKGAFDNGAKLTQAQIDMLKQLYTKNVNAFTDNMDNVFSDADYDTTYDLSGRSYNVTDKQGRGTKAADELSVFAADVLNAFRTKLGVTPMTVNSAYNELTQVSVYNIPGKSEIGGLHRSDLIGVGGSAVEFDYGVTQAYPILNEPNTYSMDQLKYNVFLQLMDAMFRDYSTDNGLIQGDHAGTLLGHFGGNNPYAKHQYLLVMLNPETGSSLANTETYVVNFSPNDETAAKFSPYDYTSKLDNNNGSSADLTDLQNKVDQARTELQQAEAAVQQAQATKNAVDQKLNDAKQAQNDAQTQLNQAKATQSQTEQALNAADQKLADTKAALAEAQKNAADHSAAIKNLQQQVADAQTKAAQAKKALDEANINVQTANDKLSQAQSALNDWTNAKKAADQKVADLQKALDNADPAAVDAAQQALTDAQTKLSEAETKADASKKTLEDTKIKLANTQKTLDEAKSKKSQTADALAKAQKALTAAQAELDRIKNSQPSTPTQAKTDAEQYGDAVQMKPIDATVNDQLPEPQFINGFHKVVKTTDSMLVLSATKTDAVSLPEGTTASWVDANTVKAHLTNAGTYYEDVLVTFPDSSTTTVKEQLNVAAAKTPDQPAVPDKPTQPSDSNKGTDITPPTSTDDHRMTTDTTTPSTSAINQSASNATGANTVESVANQINGTNEYMTREEYKAQQNAKKLPQTGNDSNRALSLVGLGLATFATMFGLSKKRGF
ncbi:SEC10/PgrA surface exclusion domain-containing protein [Limosilactobacillus reuteri]|uniref:LPXTG-motif cell wall anchor domain protein n=1 Tax=Limosilactobacillus reuteri subsp. rodentium (strain DSM 17509 / CIP 109821 / 100-23) TaxID=349123 RepID=B3XPW6_LIMR1|nr:SEC10/PgrA surface exclusion domain-containing protein [Limosilactobacillus reuteri]EDX42967.1 LPXTG-motif cell wall anchor domain protein [Limosilactobacillus reuteri subsp. rodentium]MCC4475101.1 SEC10/PgrA surface exclusion domain-containing protein [Limosilactobacillus reuteri]